MYYELYLATLCESNFKEKKWVTILVHPSGKACAYYTTMGGPLGSPPTFYQAVRYTGETLPLDKIENRRQIGYIPAVKLPAFEKTFRETVAGPSQFFATRLLYECLRRDIVIEPVFEGLVSQAEYSEAEMEYFGGGLCRADEEFLEEMSVAAEVTPLPPSLLAL